MIKGINNKIKKMVAKDKKILTRKQKNKPKFKKKDFEKEHKKVKKELEKILTKKQKNKPKYKKKDFKKKHKFFFVKKILTKKQKIKSKDLNKDFEKKHKKYWTGLNYITEIKERTELKPKEEKKIKEKKLLINIFKIPLNLLRLIILISGILLIIYPTSLNYISIMNFIIKNPDALNLKIGLGLVLIGLFSILLIYEEDNEKDTYKYIPEESRFKKIKFFISEKITLALSIWIILLMFITFKASLEVFFILILIGTIITKELTDEFTTKQLKNRLNLFIFVFLIVFIVIVTQKIINILK